MSEAYCNACTHRDVSPLVDIEKGLLLNARQSGGRWHSHGSELIDCCEAVIGVDDGADEIRRSAAIRVQRIV